MPQQAKKRRHDAAEDAEFESGAPKNKFRPFDDEAQMEEEQMSRILFGGAPSFLKSLEEAERETAGPSNSNFDSGVGEEDSDESDMKEPTPAWFDEEDDGIEVGQALDTQGRKLPSGGLNDRAGKYSTLLQHKFTSIVGTPSWALIDKFKRHDSDSDDEILQSCGFIRKGARTNLPQSVLEFKKVKDLNSACYTEGPFINCVEFHPNSSVALVAGNNGIATLYAVDGKRNIKLHSVDFKRFPIVCGKFLQNGNEALLGSRQSHIFSYDLMAAKPVRIPLPAGLTQFKKFVVSPDSKMVAAAGKWGEVHLLTAASKERVSILKQDSEVTSLAYNPQGNLLFGHSDTGEVTVWDMNVRRVVHKFADEGCLQGTTLALCNQFLAAGSAQGVVNLYSVDDVLQSKTPKPRKAILNLTTAITDLKFNPSAEVLAFSSAELQNAVKLLHVGSGTVFSNFPSYETKLGHVNAINFSPSSGFVAFGNRKSTVALYRLKHFKNY